MKPQRFSIPVESFRHLDTPFAKSGYRDYFSVISVKNLPDFSSWRRINVRDPKLSGGVPDKISAGFREKPDLFLFMNRGIVLAAHSVSFDNKTNVLNVTMTDPELHGLLDGGHTYDIVTSEFGSLDFDQFVRVEILEGFAADELPNLVDARNTSTQVKDESLMNLKGEFDKLKTALKGKSYADLIAFKEYEFDDDGNPKPIDVRDVVAILTVFDRKNFSDSIHPINSYRSKAACLKHFENHIEDYSKIYPLANDILSLYDTIRLKLPELYNSARGSKGDVSGGKFGKLTGVSTLKGKRAVKLHFIDGNSKYNVPEGFVFPILGAFRALLEEKNGKYAWGKNIDPFKLLEGDLGIRLADTIGNFALDAKNPSKTGKSPLVWQACYQAGQVAYLTI